MKYSLWCFLFGHNWLIRNIYQDEATGKILDTKWEPRNHCTNCGLTKEEAGITSPNN